MLQFLQGIADFLIAAVQLLFNFIHGVLQLLSMIPGALAMVTQSVAFMPNVLVAFAVGMISVSVVYLIIGR